MAYSFNIRHTPGKMNVVADWLSRAMESYAVEEDQEPGPSLREFFQAWRPDAEEGAEGDGEAQADRSREEGGAIEETEDVINGKQHQIRWKSKMSGLDRVASRKEGRRRIYEVETTPGVTRPQIIRILKDILKPGKTYYLHVGNAVIWRKIADMYRAGEIGGGCTVVRCERLAATIRDEKEQWEIARNHHVGKTNHRGPQELLAALRRRYYWDRMSATVEEVVKGCDVCCRVKVNTRPPQALQQVTPTASYPLQALEMDTFTWRGTSWVTIIDTLSKLAMVERVERRTADAVVAALRRWCTHYGTPESVTSDGGREFRNATVEEEARRLEIRWHTTTPGYTQGRGCIERFHGTLSDHMRVLTVDRQLDIPTAMERAIIGYNHSISAITGYSPVEVVFGGAFRQRDVRTTAPDNEQSEEMANHRLRLRKGWRAVRERLIEEKARRVLRHNIRTTDASGRVAIGTMVYRRVPTNRTKEPERYAGPYKVVAILENNRYTIESTEHPGRRRQVHLTQLKIPHKATSPADQG